MRSVCCIGLSIVLLIGAGVSVSAQRAAERTPVSETDLVKLIPALRSLAAQIRLSRDEPAGPKPPAETGAIRFRLIEDINAGKIDPLDWLIANSAQTAYPSIAEYSASCSRLASELAMRPCAVFGFGMEANELGAAKINGDIEEERRLVARGYDRSDFQERVNAVIEGLRLYYRDLEYGEFYRDSSFAWSAQSPDSLFTVTIMEANIYTAWENTSLPSGPILELSWNEMQETASGPGVRADDLPALLAKAKMSQDEFLDVITALVTARRDAREPSRLKFDETSAPDSAEDLEAFEELRRIIHARMENARLYRRYARTLDPLMDVFDE